MLEYEKSLKEREVKKLILDLTVSRPTVEIIYNMAEEYRKPNRGRYGGP